MKITISLEGFASILETLSMRRIDFEMEGLLRKVGEELLQRIRARTAAGLDAHNAQFAPYKKGYAKKREKAGLTTTPNLEYTGAMLADMTADYDVAAEKVFIYFPDSKEDRKAEINNVVREFFNVNDEDFAAITYLVVVHVNEVIAVYLKPVV